MKKKTTIPPIPWYVIKKDDSESLKNWLIIPNAELPAEKYKDAKILQDLIERYYNSEKDSQEKKVQQYFGFYLFTENDSVNKRFERSVEDFTKEAEDLCVLLNKSAYRRNILQLLNDHLIGPELSDQKLLEKLEKAAPRTSWKYEW